MRLRNKEAPVTSSRLAALILIGIYRIANSMLGTIRYFLWPRPRPLRAGTVCIYRVGNVGDTTCALPAFYAIREAYPNARLTLLTTPGSRSSPGAKNVLAGVDWIDEIREYFPGEVRGLKGSLAFLSMIRSCRFDVFIELSNDLARIRVLLRNMLLARLAGVRWAGGWSVNTLRWAVKSQSEQIEFRNEAERLLADVARYGISIANARYKLPTGHETDQRALTLLEEAGIPAGREVVALAPGAKRSTNRWPPERFASVGAEMVRRGYSVVVLGSTGEQEVAESICRMTRTGCVSLAGKTNVAEAAAILRRCRLLVCNDSGLQHTASAAGTPCVAIFSARDLWGKWHPHHPDSTMLRKWVPCHTCFLEECPNSNLCLTEISSAEVIDAVLATLLKTLRYDVSAQVQIQ